MGAAGDDPRLVGTTIAPSVIELIGNTPLVRMPRISELERIPSVLTMKMETTNPGGSSKDRPALEMILAAERDGLLRPGGTIVEPTSGNTGVGLAIVAAQRGYRCVFVMTDKVAPEKISLLKAYGAEVVVCPVAVAPEDPQSYYTVAERLTDELDAFRPNQYANPNNPLSHELTTGPELWAQTAGRITHFVAGAGTCGTITGVARYLKAKNPDVRIIAADPEGSVFSGGSGRPYLVEGVGEDFFPAAWDRDLYDDVIAISDEESFLTARRVSEVEGILIGGSGGMAVAAAIQRRQAGRHPTTSSSCSTRTPVAATCRGSSTTSGWPTSGSCGSATSASARCSTHAAPPTALLYVNPEQTVREAIELMRANGVSQLPVCKNTPPFAAAEVSGAVDELELMEAISRDPSVMTTPVEKVMGAEAADDRRRPAGRARREDARRGAGAARALGRPAARRRDAHGHPHLLRGRRRRPRRAGVDGCRGWRRPATRFETRAVHAGQTPDPATGAVVTPISLATTFAQDGVGGHKGFEYSRTGNPTRAALEACVAVLEGPATASPSPVASPPRTTCCACSRRAAGSCSATTRTAGRSA